MRPLRSFPVTFLLPAQSRCIHRPAKRVHSPSSPFACSVLPLQHSPDKPLAICSGLHRLFCSPPNPTAHTDQPNRLAPLQARSPALRSPCSTLWQPPSPLRASFAVPGNHQPFSAVRTLRHEPYRLPSAYAPHAHHQTNGHVSFLRPATVHDPHSLSCASPDLRRLAFRHPRRALHPPSRAALGSDHHCPLHPLRAASAQPFVALLTSAHPPASRFRSAATSEFSRHILAPHPVPLHTHISQTSFLTFKHIRLLCVPLAALSGNHRPLYFHSLSPPSGKTPDRSLSTAVRSPQPRPNFQLSSGTNLATPFSLCPRPASSLMRVARPAPPYFSNTRTEHLFIRPARPRLDISPSS